MGWYDASDNIMVVNFEFFMCVEFILDLEFSGLVVGNGSNNMSEYIKGDYTKCYEDICEIWYEDNLYCIVRTCDADKLIDVLNENEQLKKDVEYWKQVASQYSNELNVFEHFKKHKTECKDIHWSSD